MTLQQLQYIIALDTYRHFVRAAESCHVAQPTLTLQVKKLEEQIGLTLFDRAKQPMEPTPMGEIFIAKARQILREVEELKHLVDEDKNTLEGTFKVGVIPSLAQYLLPLFLPQFAETFPHTHLDIREMQSQEIMETLNKDQLDIGILATPLEEDTLREIPLFYEPFLVFADKESALLSKTKIEPEDLQTRSLWLLAQGHCFRNQTLNICSSEEHAEQERSIKMEGGSIETLKKLILQMQGYTLIPELSYNPDHDSSYVRKFVDPEPTREISLVVHKSFTKELLLTEMRKTILANTPKRFRKNNRFVTVKWR